MGPSFCAQVILLATKSRVLRGETAIPKGRNRTRARYAANLRRIRPWRAHGAPIQFLIKFSSSRTMHIKGPTPCPRCRLSSYLFNGVVDCLRDSIRGPVFHRSQVTARPPPRSCTAASRWQPASATKAQQRRRVQRLEQDLRYALYLCRLYRRSVDPAGKQGAMSSGSKSQAARCTC